MSAKDQDASLVIALSITHVYVKSPISAVEYRLPTPLSLTGSLSVNDRLSEAELLLEDQIYGPESLAVNSKTGMIYTGLKTGLICEIKLLGEKPKIIRAVQLSSIEGCDGSYKMMNKCGRPLGMRYLNDFDFLPDGRIVLSESSNRFEDKDFLYDMLEHRPNGRAITTSINLKSPFRHTVA
uniref:Str_synth domain-containing protein n=1 Tax=Heterorhabditis bacteriophora TaxID=37862 RepID=A0A1I7XED1_HETBA